MAESENVKKEPDKKPSNTLWISVVVIIIVAVIIFALSPDLRDQIGIGGKTRDSGTLYWENGKVPVTYNFYKSRVTSETPTGVKQTECFISGTIKNNTGKKIVVTRLTFILEDKSGIELRTMKSGAYSEINPGRSASFSSSEYLPTKLLPAFKNMGGRMALEYPD